MRLFIRLTFKVTLISLIHRIDGFMFNAWLRSTTEQNLPPVGQYKYQSYANSEAQLATGVSRYETKKDSGKSNIGAVVVTTPHASNVPADKDVIAAYNNQRTGISAPTKHDKPWNVFDAVVVHSIPSVIPPTPINYVAIPAQNYPYFYYRDGTKVQQVQNIASFTTTPASQKAVQVELNYKDDTAVEKVGENVVLNRKTPSITADSGHLTSEPSVPGITAQPNKSSPSVPLQQQNPSSPIPESPAKPNLQNRPIKLLGSNTLYTVPTNFTFTPQLYYAPAAADIQYVPYPFLKSPLLTPFLYKNTQRGVSERSEIFPSTGASTLPAAFQVTNNKAEKPICDNCQLFSSFPNYPYVKILDGNENTFQRPCAHESLSNPPTPPNFKSSNLAYLLMPS